MTIDMSRASPAERAGHLGWFVIPADHPCLPGHFPGRPLIPGAVLLDEAIALVLAQHPARRLTSVLACKFLAPVAPEERVDVCMCDGDRDTVALSCIVSGTTVLRGTIRLADWDDVPPDPA